MKKHFPFIVLAGILVQATTLFNEIIEPDGALYATIAKTMANNNDWINLFGDGHDWLDKPHFPFWMAALSFKIFGISAFAYKLPAFIFWLLGLRYVWLLAKEIYDETTAELSVIIYITALHGMLSNFDVRAEPYLTTLCTAAIYYLYKSYSSKKYTWLIACAFVSALAIMTKGIFILITIAGGMVVYWMATAQWRQFFNFKWYLLLALIALFILPEIYTLYLQFDLHPEKIVFGKTDVSGVKFFLWDSQFGRFFNTGPITGKGDPSFFIHTTLWAFLPWSVLLFVAVYYAFKKGKNVFDKKQWIIWGGAGITFLLFSLSKFQLPHYIVIIFPQMSMMVAAYLLQVYKKQSLQRIKNGQTFLLVLAALLINILCFYSGFGAAWFWLPFTVLICAVAIIFYSKANLTTILIRSCAFSFLLFLYLNISFYPALMQYQSGMPAGKFISKNYPGQIPAMYKTFSYSFEFYSPSKVEFLFQPADVIKYIKQNDGLIYTSEKNIEELKANGLKVSVVQSFDYFHITMLKLPFINQATRPKTTEKVVLIKVHEA